MAPTPTTAQPMTNQAFAEAVGCNFTMASRLRNGKRLPSFRMFLRIVEAFDLDLQEAAAAYQASSLDHAEPFGRYLTEKVFGSPE